MASQDNRQVMKVSSINHTYEHTYQRHKLDNNEIHPSANFLPSIIHGRASNQLLTIYDLNLRSNLPIDSIQVLSPKRLDYVDAKKWHLKCHKMPEDENNTPTVYLRANKVILNLVKKKTKRKNKRLIEPEKFK